MEAAIRFADATGERSAIGSLADIGRIVEGRAGTNVVGRRAALALTNVHP